jgi:hypothetical protein
VEAIEAQMLLGPDMLPAKTRLSLIRRIEFWHLQKQTPLWFQVLLEAEETATGTRQVLEDIMKTDKRIATTDILPTTCLQAMLDIRRRIGDHVSIRLDPIRVIAVLARHFDEHPITATHVEETDIFHAGIERGQYMGSCTRGLQMLPLPFQIGLLVIQALLYLMIGRGMSVPVLVSRLRVPCPGQQYACLLVTAANT